MRQVTQRLRNGQVEIVDVPQPFLQPHGVLVDVRSSLLSAGTERTKVTTGRQSLLGKARSRPDQVRQVMEKAQRDGVRDTVAAVRMRLDQPEALGYSAAGSVVAVGAHVHDIAVGDRVACAGAGYASHADVDYIPGNLCVGLPEGVDFDQGAFTTVGAIALQGVRQAGVQLGERVAVIGLGLVGQLTGQLLRAAGCRVIGIDLNEKLVRFGLDTQALDHGVTRSELNSSLPLDVSDCDAVIIAAATRSDDPVDLAAQLCRDRGRVVVLGDIGMNIPRAPYYGKELELRLSRSYGPGRYDTEYEERGLDYPIGYVRWTERRNMMAFVDLLASGRIDVRPLIRERVPINEAPRAYEQLLESEGSTLGILLQYSSSSIEMESPRADDIASPEGRNEAVQRGSRSPLNVGVIGAGSFASRVLIPGLKKSGFSLDVVASANGLSARSAAQRFAFARTDTPAGVLDDPHIGLAVIATRHATHAGLAESALNSSKAVFVEKPPCLTVQELVRLRDARADSGLPLFVGFNRRHAPLAESMRRHVRQTGIPVEVLVRVSAGPLAADHWLKDPLDGGGRLIGEGCHFIDFACWLIGSWPQRVSCSVQAAGSIASADAFTATLAFADGSLATILYGSGGASGVAKEYVEMHSNGRSAILDDFRSLSLVDGRRRKRIRSRSQDKGHVAQLLRMRDTLLNDEATADIDDPLQSMAITFTAVCSAEQGKAVLPLMLGALSGEEAGR